MTQKRTILLGLVLAAMPAAWALSDVTASGPSVNREYKIKAAFLYNFIKTCEWPKEAMGEPEEPLRIGIVGQDQFGDSFKPIEGQRVKDKPIQILRLWGFSGYPKDSEGHRLIPDQQRRTIQKCHILFICKSEKDVFGEILQVTKGLPVLTVSEVDQFLEAGGMINFLPGAAKGEFEINLIEIEKVGLKISSKLLRIAVRVLEKKQEEP